MTSSHRCARRWGSSQTIQHFVCFEGQSGRVLHFRQGQFRFGVAFTDNPRIYWLKFAGRIDGVFSKTKQSTESHQKATRANPTTENSYKNVAASLCGELGTYMRDPRIDNAKGVLILLVVLGHYLEAINGWGDRYLSLFLTAIYMFHMPAFIFLVGMTTKQEGHRTRVLKFGIILVMFQLAYVVPISIINGERVVGLFQPYWVLWFLLSLIFWTLLTPLIVTVRYAFVMSLAVAIIGGFYPGDGYQFSIMRTLTFLPFFVGGILYGQRAITVSQILSTRWYLAVAFLGVAAVTIKLWGLEKGWLYGSFTYARLGVDTLFGTLTRAALLIASFASLIAFLACIPTKRGFLSTIGQNSLAIFVIHGFFVLIFEEAITRYGPLSLHWRSALVVPLSLITTVVLANPIYSRTIQAFAGSIGKRLLWDRKL